jgi:hypothetical protein
MDEFKAKVDSHAADIYESLSAEKVEEKHRQEQEQKQKKKKNIVKAAFLCVIRDFLKKMKVLKPVSPTAVLNDLKSINSYFEKLSKENLSQDVKFLAKIAKTWADFLDNYALLSKKNYKDLHSQIKSFIKTINSYPEKTEFSLGYYLAEFAGFKWVPFPYMEILNDLHNEFVKKPGDSHLKKWMNNLEDIINPE